jgi:Domain of unknown function (DUF4375)
MGDYWSFVNPVLETININETPEVFRRTFDSVPRVSGLMYAAHFCQSEVCNGGFDQLFYNGTGVLAPEAAEAFREIGQTRIAALIESAMNLLGNSYPRDWEDRRDRLSEVPRSALDALDNEFYALIESEAGGFQHAADSYVAQAVL